MDVRSIRVAQGLTQAELARALGVKRTTVTMWEIGASAPRPAMLLRLADVLGCTVDELLRGDAEKTKNPA